MTKFQEILRQAQRERRLQACLAEQARAKRSQKLREQAAIADREMAGLVPLRVQKIDRDDYVTRVQAARMLWTCARGVMTLIDRDMLDAVMVDGQWYVSKASIEKLRKG